MRSIRYGVVRRHTLTALANDRTNRVKGLPQVREGRSSRIFLLHETAIHAILKKSVSERGMLL